MATGRRNQAAKRAGPGARPDPNLAALASIERRVLWLSALMVHHANQVRPNPDGVKVGGHQASSASAVSLMTALYCHALEPGDVVAVKAHASPAFYAIEYLRGRLDRDALMGLRRFGGLQAYPSRRKNPEVVDLSTGSMGLGAAMAAFGGLATRYLADHGGPAHPKRFIAMLGDAELDEGNVWEALLEDAVAQLDNLLWIVDVNRQSLDRVVPDSRRRQLREWFSAAGWRVIELRWGSRLAARFARPGGDRLAARLDALSNAEYQGLLRVPPSAVRKALVTAGDGRVDEHLDRALADLGDPELAELVSDVGGHDLAAITRAFDEVSRHRGGPAVILASTIKGWRLPFAADALNHGALLTAAQLQTLGASLGIDAADEWAVFPSGSPEAEILRRTPVLTPPAAVAPPEVPDALDESYPPESSTQEAFGRALGRLGRLPMGDRIVTLSADVAVTTHLAGWINRKGVYASRAVPGAADAASPALAWRESPSGQHVELGIAEHNLFLALGAFGLTAELSGTALLPIGTLYDPFVARGLDALYHALYAGARFIVAATPSGVTLSPEGGAHQSVITPGIGVALPAIRSFEPAFAQEVEWVLLDALARLLDREAGESTYLRLSTRPVDQTLAPPPSPALRAAVLKGGYRLVDARGEPGWDPEDNAVHIFAAGVMVSEALVAARGLRERGVLASVFVVTSPDLLYRGLREPRPYLESLVGADEEGVPVVSVLDGHSHALAFIGGALGVPQLALGVDHFGQSGARADLYRHYGIDAAAIARAAYSFLPTRGN